MARVLGAPSALSEAESREVRQFIEDVWTIQCDQALGSFGDDMVTVRQLFDPVARGGRLRARLQTIAASPSPPPSYLDTVAYTALDDARYLITPEGRGLYEILDSEVPDQDGVVQLETPRGLDIERSVAAAIREWSRHRLLDVISKQSGDGPPMHAAAAAMILLLLVNGSTSPATAVRRLSKDVQPRFDRSIATIIEAFADVARPSESRFAEEFRMYGGWHLSEARRRLPGQLVVDSEGRIFIAHEYVQEVMNFVVRDLARSSIDAERLVAAFDALLAAYRQQLPLLTEMGSGFERVTFVDGLKDRIQAIA